MKDWAPAQIAEAAGARLVQPAPDPSGPRRITIDSRDVRAGDLFVGLPGDRVDGGGFAAQALAAGAWGVLVAPDHAESARCAPPGALLAAEDPLGALQALARAWRRALACDVLAITGSTGKTSTKDIAKAVLAPHRRTVASPQNLNTEIGLPLAILGADAGTEVLVLELAMRGAGQISELVEICEPEVGIIVNVGPVHLELLGSLEAIAAAKAELVADLPAGATAVVPTGEALLEPHRRDDLRWLTFGDGGDVSLVAADGGHVEIDAEGERIVLDVDFEQAHHRTNLLAAVAAARALGVTPAGSIGVEFSALRGQRRHLGGDVVVIDDCYNANPMSMRAALDDLAASAGGRRVAVLGDMLELGADAERFHREIGAYAERQDLDVLVTAGPLAAAIADAFDGAAYSVADASEAAALTGELIQPGDTVLVKASRGVGLEVVARALAEQLGEAA
jgi:UDP-N-acetylmuramoyl-tripeptide--D-alanyl-D-alanine ligase